jgi:hypothetical protein
MGHITHLSHLIEISLEYFHYEPTGACSFYDARIQKSHAFLKEGVDYC